MRERSSSVRLFMVPGMAHCSGGPGPDSFDTLSALEGWVERQVGAGRDRGDGDGTWFDEADHAVMPVSGAGGVSRQRRCERCGELVVHG